MKNGPYEMVVAPKDYPGMKYRGKYAYEHHVVWWQKNGQLIPKGYEIHHVNGDHRDNRIENLSLLHKKEHHKIHSEQKRKPPIEFSCGWCGKLSSAKPHNYRSRIKNNIFGKLFCSRSCGRKNQFQSTEQVNGAHC